MVSIKERFNRIFWSESPTMNGIRHTLEGLLLMAVFLLFTGKVFSAYLLVVGFYLGRERRDHEIKAHIPTHLWYKGWNIFSWSKDGKADFFTPFILLGILTYYLYISGISLLVEQRYLQLWKLVL